MIGNKSIFPSHHTDAEASFSLSNALYLGLLDLPQVLMKVGKVQ
jgi:hypothetical protein